jgi:hypothetical protein
VSVAPRAPLPPLGRDRSLSVLLDDAFGLYRSHLGLFVLLAAGVVIPVDLIVSGIGLGQLSSGYESSPSTAAQLLPAAVSTLVTVPLITAMNVRAILAIADGRVPSAAVAAREGLDVFAAVLAAVVLVGLGVSLGILMLVVPGIIFAIHWSVVAQVITIEGVGGTAALRRSWELVKGDGWWVLGVLLVTNLIAALLAGIVTLPASAAAEEADSALIGLLATMAAEIFTLSFLAIATTILFFTLRARKQGVGTAPPPGAQPPPADPGLGRPEAPAPAPSGWEPPRAG